MLFQLLFRCVDLPDPCPLPNLGSFRHCFLEPFLHPSVALMTCTSSLSGHSSTGPWGPVLIVFNLFLSWAHWVLYIFPSLSLLILTSFSSLCGYAYPLCFCWAWLHHCIFQIKISLLVLSLLKLYFHDSSEVWGIPLVMTALNSYALCILRSLSYFSISIYISLFSTISQFWEWGKWFLDWNLRFGVVILQETWDFI